MATTIFVPKEIWPGEMRTSMVPDTVRKLTQSGAKVEIESGLGDTIGLSDATYTDAGATITSNRDASLGQADMVIRLRQPGAEDIAKLKKGCIHVSYLDPFFNRDTVQALAAQQVSAVCMELIPRTTLAQKMDALSSQASLAGYVAVIVAAERIHKVFPMMMTPAGTIVAARVFIIGAGVAGLQAIATAKRLGARVEAFDTRPVVEEQVQSLGARFIKIDLGETGQTKDGYAKTLTEEQLQKQRIAMAKHCADADVVITTAQVFGRRAPLIVTEDMVRGMKPGSVLVDLASETGGNVHGTVVDQEVNVNGVTIIGLGNLPGRVANDASLMYSNNVGSLLTHFWNKEDGTFNLDRDDEIIQGCLLTHGGAVLNEMVNKAWEGQ
ncbi:MAG: NAD(P) transhydrogenase subunit alpha [Kiritimatiellia bacterium]|jgi:H+-translocating NAD(P) transhydrogenase subunit alpha